MTGTESLENIHLLYDVGDLKLKVKVRLIVHCGITEQKAQEASIVLMDLFLKSKLADKQYSELYTLMTKDEVSE